jgi:hypothetical protein
MMYTWFLAFAMFLNSSSQVKTYHPVHYPVAFHPTHSR